jgi:hypothetical protein
MATLQTEQRRETQWHPRVQIPVEKRAPHAVDDVHDNKEEECAGEECGAFVGVA